MVVASSGKHAPRYECQGTANTAACLSAVQSTYHGNPRTTQDIDIVIDGSRSAIEAFVMSLDAESYYCDLDVALDAHSRRGQFNVVGMQSGWKIDFMIRKDRPFSVQEFLRRIPVKLLGCELFVATAEDTTIAKLD